MHQIGTPEFAGLFSRLPTVNPLNLINLRQCSWAGTLVNCSTIFTTVITDSGVCCAFNTKSSLKESTFSMLVADLQAQTGGRPGKEIRLVTPGEQAGLEMVLDQHSDRYIPQFFCLPTSSG